MARHPRLIFAGAIYHVVFRGVGRQKLFLCAADDERLLKRVAEAVELFGVRLYLYCLMSNHAHLLVETPRANLSRFMSSVLTGYRVYFNQEHRRSGHVTEERYKKLGAPIKGGVSSRCSGSNIYIEIFLEFEGHKKMHAVQKVIDMIKAALEQHIKGSFVAIIPATKPVRRHHHENVA